MTTVLIVDAANVVGSQPDGWWRDRPGAAERLISRIGAAVAAGHLPAPVVVVLEGRARAASDTDLPDGVSVVRAAASGDDTIADLAGQWSSPVVVTADRGLQNRVRAAGAEVWRPGRLLDLLGAPGPPGRSSSWGG